MSERGKLLLIVVAIVAVLMLAIINSDVVEQGNNEQACTTNNMTESQMVFQAYVSLMSHPAIEYDPKDIYRRARLAVEDYQNVLKETKKNGK